MQEIQHNPASHDQQGTLFDTTRQSRAASDPAHLEGPKEIYSGGPSIPQDIETRTTMAVVGENHSGDALPLLQSVISDISDANYRKAFSVLDDPRVISSAASRGLTVNKARFNAHTNSGDFANKAEAGYRKLQDTVQIGLGLLAALGADTSALRPISFNGLRERVSGPQNANTRTRIRRASTWKDEHTELVVVRSPRLESREGLAPESTKSSTNLTPFHRLVARININTLKQEESKAARLMALDTPVQYFDALLQPQQGVLLSPVEKAALVRVPNRYKEAIRGSVEHRTRLPEDEYRQRIGSKIVHEERLIAGLRGQRDTLSTALSVFSGERNDAAAQVLRDSMTILKQHLGIVAQNQEWDDSKTEQALLELEETLLGYKNGAIDLKINNWRSALSVSLSYTERKINLFERNVRDLSA